MNVLIVLDEKFANEFHGFIFSLVVIIKIFPENPVVKIFGELCFLCAVYARSALSPSKHSHGTAAHVLIHLILRVKRACTVSSAINRARFLTIRICAIVITSATIFAIFLGRV